MIARRDSPLGDRSLPGVLQRPTPPATARSGRRREDHSGHLTGHLVEPGIGVAQRIHHRAASIFQSRAQIWAQLTSAPQ